MAVISSMHTCPNIYWMKTNLQAHTHQAIFVYLWFNYVHRETEANKETGVKACLHATKCLDNRECYSRVRVVLFSSELNLASVLYHLYISVQFYLWLKPTCCLLLYCCVWASTFVFISLRSLQSVCYRYAVKVFMKRSSMRRAALWRVSKGYNNATSIHCLNMHLQLNKTSVKQVHPPGRDVCKSISDLKWARQAIVAV